MEKNLNQFGYVLTGQEDYALSHPNKIYQQPALSWFYESDLFNPTNIKELRKNIPLKNTILYQLFAQTNLVILHLHKKRLNL